MDFGLDEVQTLIHVLSSSIISAEQTAKDRPDDELLQEAVKNWVNECSALRSKLRKHEQWLIQRESRQLKFLEYKLQEAKTNFHRAESELKTINKKVNDLRAKRDPTF